MLIVIRHEGNASKTKMIHQLHVTGMAKSQTLIIPSIGEDKERLELIDITGGNANDTVTVMVNL